MLRPSPTSISLSANDVSFHLEHIDIYHGLLKQGFKRKDVKRFFREQAAANFKTTEKSEPQKSFRAPSCVELAIRSSKSTPTSAPQNQVEQPLPTASTPCMGVNTANRSVAIDQTEPRSLTPGCYQYTASSVTNQAVHVPRKSSLLRYSSIISSDEQERLQADPQVSFTPRSQIRYRPRTETYSYEQSEAESSSSSSSLITVFEELALQQNLLPIEESSGSRNSRLRGDAQEFTPQSLIHGNERHDSLTNERESGTFSATVSRIIPKLISKSSTQDLQRIRAVPSSSPPSIGHSGAVRNMPVEPPTLPAMPATPSTPRPLLRVSNSRTEPRHTRFQYLDGPSFTPYNDSLPPGTQPQTPADLVRSPLVGEFNAAYTAPPGRLSNDVSPLRLGSDADLDPGQASPTARAIQMRQRRNREYARSARVEGLRISRLRERQTRRGDEQPRPDVWIVEEHLNLWRDDLDADRVGAENFEDADRVDEMVGSGIREVSGNLRANNT